jgi:hypothetical protein
MISKYGFAKDFSRSKVSFFEKIVNLYRKARNELIAQKNARSVEPSITTEQCLVLRRLLRHNQACSVENLEYVGLSRAAIQRALSKLIVLGLVLSVTGPPVGGTPISRKNSTLYEIPKTMRRTVEIIVKRLMR